MRTISFYLFLLSVLASGCGMEKANGIQKLEDGEFVVNLFSSNGDLLLTKRGNAENFASTHNQWEIRLLDPGFALQSSNLLGTFASLTIFGHSEIQTPQELKFNSDNSASFHQRWYSLEGDWGYRSTSGTLIISSLEERKIQGSFEISMEVDAGAHQNPFWGERILIKGDFSALDHPHKLLVEPEIVLDYPMAFSSHLSARSGKNKPLPN